MWNFSCLFRRSFSPSSSFGLSMLRFSLLCVVFLHIRQRWRFGSLLVTPPHKTFHSFPHIWKCNSFVQAERVNCTGAQWVDPDLRQRSRTQSVARAAVCVHSMITEWVTSSICAAWTSRPKAARKNVQSKANNNVLNGNSKKYSRVSRNL